MKFTMMMFILLLPQLTYAQDFQDEEETKEYWDNHVGRNEGDFQSEIHPVVTDEVARPDIERQEEEPLYPEGEETNWSLGGEDLAAEEFE